MALLESCAMARVADHLSVAELEHRFRACPDPVEAPRAGDLAAGPGALANGRRRNGLKPSLLTAAVLEVVRLRLAEPPPDGGLWSSRKVAEVIAVHLGLERVLPRRGWEVLQALGYTRPRPKNPKSATADEAQAFEKSWRTSSPRRRPPIPACRSKCSAPSAAPPRPEAGPARGVGPHKGRRPTALGHHRLAWLCVTAFVGPATGETVWYLSNGVSKSLFAGLLAAFATTVGAGPKKRIVLLLDNAGFHARPNLAVPDGITLVHLPPYSPEL